LEKSNAGFRRYCFHRLRPAWRNAALIGPQEHRRPLTRCPCDSFINNKRGTTMDKDRIQGSVEQAKGKVKEVAGKATGDAKLESEGKAQKTAGKMQNTVGGVKDAVKEAVDK
jgi:uncharacterized protein YjbJ (UPF0337 family)